MPFPSFYPPTHTRPHLLTPIHPRSPSQYNIYKKFRHPIDIFKISVYNNSGGLYMTKPTTDLTLPEAFSGTSIDEQETTITAARADDYIRIYTSDNTMLTKLRKLLATNDTEYRLIDVQYSDAAHTTAISVMVEAPARCLSFRAGSKREMSDEQRQALADRMKQMAANRKK